MNHPFNGSQSCSQVDPELFFPVTPKEIRESLVIARPICKACPVLAACTTYSQAHPELQGIWAGSFLKSQFYTSPVEITRKAS